VPAFATRIARMCITACLEGGVRYAYCVIIGCR
jgi:hypothetical protein